MKCNLIILASLAATLTACSNDELIDAKQDPITFHVSTENMTRATGVMDNNNFKEFTLYADYKATSTDNTTTTLTFLNGCTVEYKDSKWALTDGDIYWPASGTLDFYAVANNDKDSYNYSNGTRTVTHKVAETVANQTDLLYAVTTGQTKTTNSTAGVSLHFRHALSQIAFQAKCTNDHLKIEISEVLLYGVKGEGTLTLPEETTTQDFTATIETSNSKTIGTWVPSTTASVTEYKITGLSTTLTKSSDDATSLSDNRMLLIPQTTTALAANTAIANATGSYLGLKCKIYNYQDDSNIVPLYPTSGTDAAYVYIPAKFEWKPGHKYVYTFVFGGTTTGGYDKDGKSVLTPITYSVDVNDFLTITGNQDASENDEKDAEMK
jgi:hypothetical protein